MTPGPTGWFLLLAGLWLTRVCLTADDARWGRLTVTWPVPWSHLDEPRRRLLRRGGAWLGGLLAVGGAALLLLARQR